jgi:hypothetical protein
MRHLHYQTLSGSKIGTGKRKKYFLDANGHTNPGPGTYKNITFALLLTKSCLRVCPSYTEQFLSGSGKE